MGLGSRASAAGAPWGSPTRMDALSHSDSKGLPAGPSCPFPLLPSPRALPVTAGAGRRGRTGRSGGGSELVSVPALGVAAPRQVAICNGDNHKAYRDDRRVAWARDTCEPCPRAPSSQPSRQLLGRGDQRGEGRCGRGVSEPSWCRNRAFVPGGGGSSVLGTPQQTGHWVWAEKLSRWWRRQLCRSSSVLRGVRQC